MNDRITNKMFKYALKNFKSGSVVVNSSGSENVERLRTVSVANDSFVVFSGSERTRIYPISSIIRIDSE